MTKESEFVRRRAVSILGGRAGNAGGGTLELAEAVGAELGRRGYAVVTGGDGGVARAASRGCVSAGGESIALLKWNRLDDCGPNVTLALPTSMDLARSNILNWAGDGVIAFEGRFGTLSEIALALDTARPLLILGRPRFLDPQALDAPSCQVMAEPSVAQAASIVDALESLIAKLQPPPVRPTAGLFPSSLTEGGRVALRHPVPTDLTMFRRAFADSEVRAWWDLEPSDEALSQFQHERCLVIVEADRPIGFIEYHAEANPDFDHVGVDIVIADGADRGRGLGSAALTRFARTAFGAGHHRITVVPSDENERAIRCYEKVGFKKVGVMRDYERYRGRWRNALLLDLVPEDLA